MRKALPIMAMFAAFIYVAVLWFGVFFSVISMFVASAFHAMFSRLRR